MCIAGELLEQERLPEGRYEGGVRVREHSSVESARVKVRYSQLGVPFLRVLGERDGVFYRNRACAPVLAEAGPEPCRSGRPPVVPSVDVFDEPQRFQAVALAFVIASALVELQSTRGSREEVVPDVEFRAREDAFLYIPEGVVLVAIVACEPGVVFAAAGGVVATELQRAGIPSDRCAHEQRGERPCGVEPDGGRATAGVHLLHVESGGTEGAERIDRRADLLLAGRSRLRLVGCRHRGGPHGL